MGAANPTMKFSLFNAFKRKQKEDVAEASAPLPQLAGGSKTASLASVRIQLLLAAVVLLGVLAVFCYQLMSGTIMRALIMRPAW